MEALKQKWNSRRGASILLALLFMLVCMMVGASVVMAAASNAGKIQSNKKEQQKYLTLSSALNLLVDELESVEYVGKFTYTDWMDNSSRPKEFDNSVNPPKATAWYTDHYYTYTQTVGTLQPRASGAAVTLSESDFNALKDILPLFNDMDTIFAKEFDDSAKGVHPASNLAADIKDYTYKQESNVAKKRTTYTLTLEVKDESGDYGDLSHQVNVTVNVNADGVIYLNANLESDTNFTMRATLSPTDKGPDDLRPDSESDRTPKLGKQISSPTIGNPTTATYMTDPVTWTLVEIVKVNYAGGGTSEAPTTTPETTDPTP